MNAADAGPAIRPPPMVPPEVDLSQHKWTPLYVEKLMNSDLFAMSSGDEFKAACALWCKSWSQVPAGSLPSRDDVLCYLAGCRDPRSWRKVKAMALHGWVLCSDGRLYHPLIAANALQAWESITAEAKPAESKDQRQSRWRARRHTLRAMLAEHGHKTSPDLGIGELLRLAQSHIPGFDSGALPGKAPAAPPTPKKTESGTGETKEPEAAPTDAGRVCLLIKRAGFSSVNPGDLRLAKLIKEGATDQEFIAAAEATVNAGKGWGWLLGAVIGKRTDAASLKLAPLPAAALAAPADPLAWADNRNEVIAAALNLGISEWSAAEASARRGPSWETYRKNVIAAWQKERAAEPGKVAA